MRHIIRRSSIILGGALSACHSFPRSIVLDSSDPRAPHTPCGRVLSTQRGAALSTLDSLSALENASSSGRSAVLWLRGFDLSVREAAVARNAFTSALRSAPPSLRAVVVDDSSDAHAAAKLAAALGVSSDSPFACIIHDFSATRTKYLLNASVTDARALSSEVELVVSGRSKPTLLGQSRPPADRAPGGGPDAIEVVTDTLEELVLRFPGRCILVTYSRACDACAAFAPRLRMFSTLLARHAPNTSIRVARINAAENDIDPEVLPPRAPTPTVLAFQGGRVSGVLRFDIDSGGRARLPSIIQLSHFALDGLPEGGEVSVALLDAAALAEKEADRIERAFDALSPYAALWRQETEAAAIGKGSDSNSSPTALGELKTLLTNAYEFIIDEASLGDASRVEILVNSVRAWKVPVS
jgi:hypothetical protein